MWVCGESEDQKHHDAIIAKILLKNFINSKKIFEKNILWCYNWQKQKMTAGHKRKGCSFFVVVRFQRTGEDRICEDAHLKNVM